MRWDLAKESNDVTQWINLAAVFGSGTFCGKSNEELQEIYQKGLSSDGIMKEFRVPKDDDLTWEFEN